MDAILASLNFPESLSSVASRTKILWFSMACYEGIPRKTLKWANFQVCTFITNLYSLFCTISWLKIFRPVYSVDIWLCSIRVLYIIVSLYLVRQFSLIAREGVSSWVSYGRIKRWRKTDLFFFFCMTVLPRQTKVTLHHIIYEIVGSLFIGVFK